MKTLFVLLAFLMLGLNQVMAGDKSILVLEAKKDLTETTPTISGHFNINKDLGRAWVTVAFAYYTGDSTKYHSTFSSVLVEGLSYDTQTQRVVFNRDGVETVCADKKWYGLKATKRCAFNVKEITRRIDNGFYIVSETFYQVFMNVQQ
ncbi:MAG: hypothetical protein A2X86_20805 [Bdellovibrionales bacterium GWA2_49_15]|nr:MAG: hypothetical protein A2X86_20805 [Bdellovibrionales bacterium GWA2_49_15]HAZ13161.1 hypothetical protein [Bdellovibrionales bacterium]